MARPKGSKNAPKETMTYRDGNNNLILAREKFMEGETPPPPAEDKGNIRALLQTLSVTLKTAQEITAQKVIDWEVEYLHFIYSSDTYIIPDYLGWCSFVGLSHEQMDRAQQTKMRKEVVIDGNGNEIYASASELIEKAKNDFMAIKSQLGLSGKMPPLLYVGMMNNGGGWSAKHEIEIKSAANDPIATASNAELDKLIDDYKNGNAVEAEFSEIEK